MFFLFTIFALLIQAGDIDPNSLADYPYKLMHLTKNPDGSLTRAKDFYPTNPPNNSISHAFSRDVTLNKTKKTWIRLYLPNKSNLANLPVIIFGHGGGFIILSTATPSFDLFLSKTAGKLNVLIVSVEYRLTPENRLPAAYDDFLEALQWVKKKNDDWVRKYADVSKCIVMGESSGANVAYNAVLRASLMVRELRPLVIRGLVLVQPFIGGVLRTGSELRKAANTPGLPLVVMDFLWNQSLPLGTNRDHLYCNPLIRGGSRNLDKIKRLGWPITIMGCNGDILIDRQLMMFDFLKQQGVNVIGNFSIGGYHGVFLNETAEIEKLYGFTRSVFPSILPY
ncbi:carboxylesterase 1-like [Spinacia oleracea]|uniref:Carboxylesterase 1-like n=1 Tax=Spinacia oleracea TaxID=3562 RepID=A0ABM3RNL3_SPIOL|nr:carboxylesterase 1-like [Spinacia oleracea]